MAQIFSRQANLLTRLVLASLVLGLPLAFFIGGAYYRSGWRTGQDVIRAQPVPFSHRHHVGQLGIDCRYCHTSVETSAFAGLPSTDICMSCHSQLWTNAEMLAPVRQSMAGDKPIRWRRVHDLPDFVYFDHSIHVQKGVGCESCHGRIDQMPLTRQAESLLMHWCLDCHRQPERHLRPQEAIFTMGWTPPADQLAQGRRLAEAHRLDRNVMVNCSTCHR
ncbi:MAG TPA: cytochrome c3 family protein [Gammaproteobacteria bacterium]|nr:cytochrome c3 family protein [Gammaproteobacteria bacterium]